MCQAADQLAGLTAKPNIGAVHVVGNARAHLFKLHSSYNTLTSRLFDEMSTRGISTSNSSTWVSKLTMHDNYHARDTKENRQTLLGFVADTTLVMRYCSMTNKALGDVNALKARFTYLPPAEGYKVTPEMQNVLNELHETTRKRRAVHLEQSKTPTGGTPMTDEDYMRERTAFNELRSKFDEEQVAARIDEEDSRLTAQLPATKFYTDVTRELPERDSQPAPEPPINISESAPSVPEPEPAPMPQSKGQGKQ